MATPVVIADNSGNTRNPVDRLDPALAGRDPHGTVFTVTCTVCGRLTQDLRSVSAGGDHTVNGDTKEIVLANPAITYPTGPEPCQQCRRSFTP